MARSKECSTFLIPTPTSHALLPSMAPWRTQPPPAVTCPSSSPTLSPVSVHLMAWKELRFECVWWSTRGNGIFRVKFGLTFHYTDLLCEAKEVFITSCVVLVLSDCFYKNPSCWGMVWTDSTYYMDPNGGVRSDTIEVVCRTFDLYSGWFTCIKPATESTVSPAHFPSPPPPAPPIDHCVLL